MDIDQTKRDYEILNNPELQRHENNPSEVQDICRHDKVYKTLATVGDFTCRIWYYDSNYDALNSTEGTKRIHIVPSESDFLEDYNKWLNIANASWSEGVIFVNPIIRLNGTTFPNNKDLKDCVKYISGVANHYGASKDKIVSIDPLDGDKMYEMSYDVTSAKTYSDVSNNVYSDFTSNLSSGSVSLDYTTSFATGSISLDNIRTLFSGNNNIGSYYRGGGVANITQNNNVPTSGQISFGNLRNVVSAVTAQVNGNWTHLQARYEIYGNNIYQSNLKKTMNINGNVGAADNNDPAIRFNSGGNGVIELNVVNTGGSPVVRGYSGNSGSSNSGTGGGGGIALVASSNVRVPTSHYNNRIKGGGGGGGGGGKGGKGGGGGHGGGRRCKGWFCGGSYRVCSNNGGAGGNGGNGGAGGRGAGYYWNSATGQWVAASTGGSNGSGGAGGSSRSGGTGGTGGKGGNGGSFESAGSNGDTGNTGNQGGSDQEGCGYHSSGRSGKAGTGGGPPGGGGSKATGNVTTT